MSKTTNRFAPDVRERAVLLLLDTEGGYSSRWVAIASIVATIGISGNRLLEWFEKPAVISGKPAGVPIKLTGRLMALEYENRGLRQASDIQCKASVYFAGRGLN